MWSFLAKLVPWGAIWEALTQHIPAEWLVRGLAGAALLGAGFWGGYRCGSPEPIEFTERPPAEPNLPVEYETEEDMPAAHIVMPALPAAIYTYGRDTDTTEGRIPIPNDLLREAPLSGSSGSGYALPGLRRSFYGYLTSRNPVEVTPRSAILTAYDPASLRWRRLAYRIPPHRWGYDTGIGVTSDLGALTRSGERFAQIGLEATGSLRYRSVELGIAAGLARVRGDPDPYGTISLRYILWSR